MYLTNDDDEVLGTELYTVGVLMVNVILSQGENRVEYFFNLTTEQQCKALRMHEVMQRATVEVEEEDMGYLLDYYFQLAPACNI